MINAGRDKWIIVTEHSPDMNPGMDKYAILIMTLKQLNGEGIVMNNFFPPFNKLNYPLVPKAYPEF